jgi:hypothetical protein
MSDQRDPLLDDYQDVMQTRQGRAVIRDILSKCGMDRSSFTNGQSNQTIFNEGKRRVGIDIQQQLLELDPDLYLKFVKEGIDQ